MADLIVLYHILYCIIICGCSKMSHVLNSNIIKHAEIYNSHTLAHYRDNMQYTDGQVSASSLSIRHFFRRYSL